MSYEKIDVHAHYLSPGYKAFLKKYYHDFGDGVKTPAYEIEDTLKTMDEQNISYSILSISSPHINTGERTSSIALAEEVNEYAKQQHQRYPEQIGFFASLPITFVEDSVKMANQIIQENEAAGFALPTNSKGLYLGNPKLDVLMQTLDDAGAIVAIHPNEPGTVIPQVTEDIPKPIMEFFFDTTRTVVNMLEHGVFQRYPHIKFIIPHAGAVLPIIANRLGLAQALNSDLTDAQVDITQVMGQQYFDVAGMVLSQQLPMLLEMVDPDKILYASDTPYTPGPVVSQLAQKLEQTDMLSEPVKQKLFNENAKRLFKLD